MTPAEASDLLARCAMFDNRKPSAAAAVAWASALNDTPLDPDAFAAVSRFYGTPPKQPGERLWIQPHDVKAHRSAIRAARLGDTVPAYLPMHPDETGAEYVARRQAQIRAIADGREQPVPIAQLAGGPHPDVAARIRQLGDIPAEVRQAAAPHTLTVLNGQPTEGPERRPRDAALAVDCPRADCRAQRNRPCHRPSGKELHATVHHQRQDAYTAAIAEAAPP